MNYPSNIKVIPPNQQAPLSSEDVRNARDQIAQMMKQGSKLQKKKSSDSYNQGQPEQWMPLESEPAYEEELYDSKHQHVIQNNKTIPDVINIFVKSQGRGLKQIQKYDKVDLEKTVFFTKKEGFASQTQYLMQDIISSMKDQEIQNQLKMLTDQEISKQITNMDFKNMINRMHQGISSEQQQLMQKGGGGGGLGLSIPSFINIADKSPYTDRAKSKSPMISARSKQVIARKQQLGEYKPIYERLDEIKQHSEAMKQRTKLMYPKVEEPIPSFHPEINKNTNKILKRQRSRIHSQNNEEGWEIFLQDVKDWEERKISNIRVLQAEKAFACKQSHPFQPVINHQVNEKIEHGQNDTPDVVDRLYARMREKKERDKERLQQIMSLSPFTPKIDPNSEKLFVKMTKGEKKAVEDRLLKKDYFIPGKNFKHDYYNKSPASPIFCDEGNTVKKGNSNNSQQLGTILEQGNLDSPTYQNNNLNKSTNNIDSIMQMVRRTGSIMNVGTGNNPNRKSKMIKASSTQQQQQQQVSSLSSSGISYSGSSAEQRKQSPFQASSKQIPLPKTKDLLQLLNGGQSLSKSMLSPEKQRTNLLAVSTDKMELLSQSIDPFSKNKRNKTPKDDLSQSALPTITVQSPLSSRNNQDEQIKGFGGSKNKGDNIGMNQSNLNFLKTKFENNMSESKQLGAAQPKNSHYGKKDTTISAASAMLDDLKQSLAFSEIPEENQQQQQKQQIKQAGIVSAKKIQENEFSINPVSEPSSTFSKKRIRSPKLNHSPFKNQSLNYFMTTNNIKANKDALPQASKFEILNAQVDVPLRDIDNINPIPYGENLKYIIQLLSKADPSVVVQIPPQATPIPSPSHPPFLAQKDSNKRNISPKSPIKKK